MNLETYEEKTIFSTIMPSETVVDLSFSHNGDYVLITTQYKCVEFNLITGEEMIVARSAGQERFLYGNYSGKWIEVTVTEGSEEGLPTRCEFYSKVAKYAGFEFSKEWYYIVPYLPEELYTYYVHGNGDIGKEGPHDENGIQRYRLTRGFFLEDRPEFARILNPECYQVDGDSVTPLCFHFGKLEMICVRHKKALASQKGMENLITYMYLDEKMGEAILARDSADLAWVSNLSSATYEILWGVFDRHIGNDKGYYSWSTWTENGSTYSVDAGEQCFVANIPTTLPNAWSAQLYQVIDVPASGSYRVTFKAKASMNREIRLALEKDGQSPLMDETMSVSADWTNYSYDFTVSSAASGVKLVFMLGNVGTTENMAHTISIDDISLYKVS